MVSMHSLVLASLIVFWWRAGGCFVRVCGGWVDDVVAGGMSPLFNN